MAGDAGALPEILDGLALVAETGSQRVHPASLRLAEAQRAAGQLAEAQGTVATGPGRRRTDGPALLRRRPPPPRRRPAPRDRRPADEAAARYHRALAIAREQGARSFELRAATSLARLWRDEGKARRSVTICSRRSTRRSPKASIRVTCKTRRRWLDDVA
jgi:hypothetical protein